MRITTLSKKDDQIENLYTVYGAEIETSDGGKLKIVEKDGVVELVLASLRVISSDENSIQLSLIDEIDN